MNILHSKNRNNFFGVMLGLAVFVRMLEALTSGKMLGLVDGQWIVKD